MNDYDWTTLPMRQCHKCGYESDDLEEFCTDSRYKYGRKNLCKWCSNHNISHNNTVRERRVDLRRLIDSYKNKPCADCGGIFPPCVMDFHHDDPSKKEFCLSQVIPKSFVEERVIAEIEKCTVLCANCHRIRTFKEQVDKYASDGM